MSASARGILKKRPAQKGTPVMVRLQPAQLAQLDTWIAHQPEPQPPEAVRRILEARLVHEEERGRL